ncbi:cytochrome P450 [Micromonospora sp. PPF5-6]|uniref:cytochrome P450 n=1 Tax=Micromonospora sp. PPF5-6 TaxID=2708085 RepID=UPI0019543846|nr:cytochrome P450 [Micromonospora sp. PPF5-6]
MSVDPAPLVDPRTYVDGVPYDLLAELRAAAPVVWVDEPPLLGLPGGPGFWLVLRHADVTEVLKQPGLFSSRLGATQIRDPATPADLDYVRRMMLNMDPPEHGRLRRPVARSFTPRAVAALEASIRANAAALVDRVIGDADEGTCDFARDLAADLPLLTLADVLGMPEPDRWLLYDWSNRVIGFQDPDYAVSAAFDPEAGTPAAREALRHRPAPDADGRMPDPRTRAGMADLYAYAHLLAESKRRDPGPDVMSILLAQRGEDRLTVDEFENMFWLFAVAGNETIRNGLPGAMIALLEHPDELARLRDERALFDTAVDELLRWWTPAAQRSRTGAGAVDTVARPDTAAGR